MLVNWQNCLLIQQYIQILILGWDLQFGSRFIKGYQSWSGTLYYVWIQKLLFISVTISIPYQTTAWSEKLKAIKDQVTSEVTNKVQALQAHKRHFYVTYIVKLLKINFECFKNVLNNTIKMMCAINSQTMVITVNQKPAPAIGAHVGLLENFYC